MTGQATYRRADRIDTFLMLLFLLGIYLEFSPRLAAGVPVPCALAGVAGLTMLFRNARMAHERQLVALVAVIGLFLLSILSVGTMEFIGERLKGFIQISYSLIIAYGAWLTMMLYERERLSRLFLWFCVAIIVGCALERYAGLGAISDAVRLRLYPEGVVYDADTRDLILYGGVRPKLFTSEPSHVAFAFTVFGFIWYVLTTVPRKTLVYAVLLAAGMVMMRSPTLVLGFALVVPYQLLIGGRSFRGPLRGADVTLIMVTAISLGAIAAGVFGGAQMFSERVEQISTGHDQSFFSRVIGPFLVAVDTIQQHPVAGAGLTGEEYIEDRVHQVYYSTPTYNERWALDDIRYALTNYFYLHWIYLGLMWGAIMLWALTRFLKTLYVPSASFCWIIWATMGHAAGAYVSPKPWTVLILSAAAAVLHYRQPFAMRRPVYRPRAPMLRTEPQLRSGGPPR